MFNDLRIRTVEDQLEPQLATAEFAARRGRRLDEGAHMISFRPTNFGARECKAWKYSRINDAGEYNLFRIFDISAARHFFLGRSL
jgi:hypothetical protein